MARTDYDTWDITEGVGATALHIAAARAAETRSAKPLVDDPYAQLFLAAAGEDLVKTLWGAAHPSDCHEAESAVSAIDEARLSYTASRTKFFDDFFIAAFKSGVRQAVILAAGLDARAWRLPWPHGAAVYEIDQPKVLHFKAAVLEEKCIQPKTRYVAVPCDLRHDWPNTLRRAGFDPTSPTAWLAEGLLPYLPAQAQDLLFERIHSFSAVGSEIAVEEFDNAFFDPANLERHRELRRQSAAAAAEQGRSIPDTTELWYLEQRGDVAEWLRAHGWSVRATTAKDAVSKNHRLPAGTAQDAIPKTNLIESRLGGRRTH